MTAHADEATRDGAKLRIGVMDLGSTSFHLLVADATPTGEITRIARRREMLRLGATLDASGEIPEDACALAVEAAGSLRALAESLDIDRILLVATAALRDARNGAALAQRIGDRVDQPVRLLTGRQEARLIFAAFRHRVPLGDRNALGIDLGGGSCELAVGNAWDLAWETTLPVGVTRLHRELVTRDPMRRGERKAIRKRVASSLAPHRDAVLAQGPARCIASGGTVRALARLIDMDARPGGAETASLRVSQAELSLLTDTLVRSSHEERLAMPGIKRGRADLLPTGAVILHTLADQLDVEEIVVCDWGLREGAVLEALGLIDPV